MKVATPIDFGEMTIGLATLVDFSVSVRLATLIYIGEISIGVVTLHARFWA